MKEINHKWEQEFFQIEFKDTRLRNRFFHMMDAFSSSPAQSILSASGSRSSAKAGVYSVWKGLEKLNTLLTYREFLA